MRALSLELIKGFIDEIDQKIHVTWVKPRVLDLNQVRACCITNSIEH
jgi:26S proteasome regulatory subunit N9